MNSKVFPYIIVGLAGTILLALTVVVVFTPLLLSSTNSILPTPVADVAATNSVVLPDPLITVVPKDQQSSQRKTKVFISDVDPKLGAEQPKIVVIVFGDWADTASRDYLSWANDIVQQYPQDVTFVWKDYVPPEQLTEHSTNVALTAHCLNEQAVFWQATDAIASLTTATSINYSTLLPDSGIDHGSVEECVTSKVYQAAVHYGYYYGQSVGVTNGHSIFINDTLYADVLTKEQLIEHIDAVLEKY